MTSGHVYIKDLMISHAIIQHNTTLCAVKLHHNPTPNITSGKYHFYEMNGDVEMAGWQ